MATADDVAAYILARQGPMSAWKLQKLVYYAQAWSLVWDERTLFDERIEAWANGPVVPALYRKHRGKFKIGEWSYGDPEQLTAEERETVDAVLAFYGERSGHWLSELSHAEEPWLQAREGLAEGERGNREITVDSMADYYGAL